MSPAELTYNELLASPDLEQAAAQLSARDLCAVRGHLARGEACGWAADRVHGICILEDFRRYEASINGVSGTGDKCHGSEVRQ